MERKLKGYIVLLLWTLFAVCLWAQGPNDTGKYYKSANGKTGAELKMALYQIIKEPNVVTYGNGLKMGYVRTDTRPDGYLRDFYSCVTKYVPGSDMAAGEYEGFNYNREHTVCQSWFGSVSPMYSDIVMVIPTDGYINSRRNNNPFGEVTDKTEQVKTSQEGYSKWGAPRQGLVYPDSVAQRVTTVFEPNDEVKGDIARIYFYMATCYENIATTFVKGTGDNVFNAKGTTYEPLRPWVMEMMMRWSAIDPVDSIETARNDSVFVVQGNRNPFVDYPGLEDFIWGDRQEEAFVYGDDDSDDEDDNPSQSGTIILNNEFFGVDWTGQRPSGGVTQMKGKKGGITVTYAKGKSGQSMFCNNQQIRLYKFNELTFSCSDNEFAKIEFNVVKNDNEKEFFATNGTVDGYIWTGQTSEVMFTVSEGNGNIQLASVDITLAHETTTIPSVQYAETMSQQDGIIYDLQGRRINYQIDNRKSENRKLPRGLYIRNGRKFIVR